MALIGGIEAGGTKFVCAVSDEKFGILREERFPTTTPDETIGRCIAFFRSAQDEFQAEHGPIAAIGVGTFGPVDINVDSPTYGFITSTPKPHWANADLIGGLKAAFPVPMAFDTDVNAAAVGEGEFGAGQGCDTFMYLTVGTGVGGGAVVNGKPLHGLVHPEMGHVLLPLDDGDDFAGNCPYHGTCVEGMVSGPAIAARWGVSGDQLPEDHQAWDIEARYLAKALAAYIVTLSPQRIILGGGVMHQLQLFPKIRRELKEILNGYVQHPAVLEEQEDFVVPPGLGDKAGITGALLLASAQMNEYYSA